MKSKYLDELKTACLFCGTIIGAGFATGREISLYFGNHSIYTAIFGGIMCGILCTFFMFIGKYNVKIIDKRIYSIIMTIGALIIYIAMFAGAESLIFSYIKYNNAGILSTILCIYIGFKSIEYLKNVNLIVVFLIIILIIIVAINYKTYTYNNDFHIGVIFSYGAMNILLSIDFSIDQGREKSTPSIIRTGIYTSVFLSILIALIYLSIKEYKDLPMPFYSAALNVSLGLIATIIIYFAIITTLLSAIKILINNAKMIELDNNFIIFTLIIVGVILGSYSFEVIVNKFYYYLSFMGLVLTFIAVIKMIKYIIKTKKGVISKNINTKLIKENRK